MRSFNLSNCQEVAPNMIPTVVSPWNSCTGWKIMDGEFYGCYSSNSTGQVIRKYNFNSSSMIKQFSVPNWSNFQPSFGASSWVRLPSDDYPDLVYNYSTQYFIHSSDSKIAQIVLVSDKTIKVFSLDITSF